MNASTIVKKKKQYYPKRFLENQIKAVESFNKAKEIQGMWRKHTLLQNQKQGNTDTLASNSKSSSQKGRDVYIKKTTGEGKGKIVLKSQRQKQQVQEDRWEKERNYEYNRKSEMKTNHLLTSEQADTHWHSDLYYRELLKEVSNC
jgi:hypothetical protein